MMARVLHTVAKLHCDNCYDHGETSTEFLVTLSERGSVVLECINCQEGWVIQDWDDLIETINDSSIKID